MRQLHRRLGEINAILQAEIRGLSSIGLEELGEALLDFSETSNLVSWLDTQQRREGEIALILRQLIRRLGEVDRLLIERVSRLSIEQLETLGEALLDFAEVSDLVMWLEQCG